MFESREIRGRYSQFDQKIHVRVDTLTDQFKRPKNHIFRRGYRSPAHETNLDSETQKGPNNPTLKATPCPPKQPTRTNQTRYLTYYS